MTVVPENLLRELFGRAVTVADPMRSLANFLPERPKGNFVVIGAGKASARMAEAVEKEYGSCQGFVITRYGYSRPCKSIEIVEASHPTPDQAGFDATKKLLAMLETLEEDDFVLCLISGGASSLLVAPAGSITLAEKQRVNDALLASGAPITQVNCVRKHLSDVKGGKLAAAAWPATMLSLIVSDVAGDNPADIGSGPTVGDFSTPQDAKQILQQWHIEVPKSVKDVLTGDNRVLHPSDEKLSTTENKIIAAPSQSLDAAAKLAIEHEIEVEILGDAIEGEAREIAKQHAALAMSKKQSKKQGDKPILLLSGGELTVTRTGNGVGGPNAEYCLALALALDGEAGIHALACDTDGVDGAADIAGAVIDPTTLVRAREKGLDPEASLNNNDAHTFFTQIDNSVVTGPTLTNVNDFRAILIV